MTALQKEVEESDLGVDRQVDLFNIAGAERRRMVFDILSGRERMLLSDLADIVTARETGKSQKEITSTERKRVYVGLYQCHLPKMDDAGVIDFDQDRAVVEAGDGLEEIAEWLKIGERVAQGEKNAIPNDDPCLLDRLKEWLP